MKLCICVLLILVLISPSEGVSGVKIAGCSLILHGGHRVVGNKLFEKFYTSPYKYNYKLNFK